MASTPYLVSAVSPTLMARTLRDGVSHYAVNAESAADALALVKAQYGADNNAAWDQGTQTAIAVPTDMNGWALRLRVITPLGVVKFDKTVEADGTDTSLAKASKTLVSSADYGNTETVTIDTKVYTFVTTIGVTEGNVLRGVSEVATMANLVSAITHVGGTAGVNYVTAAVHPTVTAASDGVHTVTVTAKVGGSAGNSIALAETAASAAWAGAATALSGGVGAIDKVSALGQKMVAALNAAGVGITGAAWNDSTHVLTVASTGDSLGDHRVFPYFIPVGADRLEIIGIPGFVASQVDTGSAGAALTITSVADTYSTPKLVSVLGPQVS